MTTAATTSTLRALAHAGRVPDPEIPEKAKRRQFSAKYKLDILAEYDRATEPGAKGALLRREGLYSSHIVEWRRARDVGALAALEGPRAASAGSRPRASSSSGSAGATSASRPSWPRPSS